MTALYLGLDPHPEHLDVAVLEPGFGHLMESFSTTWETATQVLGEQLRSFEAFFPLGETVLAFCPDDPCWPLQFTNHLRGLCNVHTPHLSLVTDVLQMSTRLLQRDLRHKRAALLAFLARHDSILGPNFSGCSIDLSNRDLACAWALQTVRQELLEVELAIGCGGYDVSTLNPFEPIHVVAQAGPRDPDIVPF